MFLELLDLCSRVINSLPALDHLSLWSVCETMYYNNYSGLLQTSLIQTLDTLPGFSFILLPSFVVCGWHDNLSFLIVLTLNLYSMFFITYIHTYIRNTYIRTYIHTRLHKISFVASNGE